MFKSGGTCSHLDTSDGSLICKIMFLTVNCFVFLLSCTGLTGKINEFQPLSPREVPHGKTMYLHNGMFYHAMDLYYPRVRKQNMYSIT